VSDGFILLGAQNQANWGILAREHPMLARVVEVQMHLPGVRMRERAELQIDHDETAQVPMEEEEIDPIPGIPDPQATLACDKGKAAAEFEQEGLQVTDQCFLKFEFGVLVFEIQEFEGRRDP
jgi:hypothetical protein